MLDGDNDCYHDYEDNVRVDSNQNDVSSSYIKGDKVIANWNGWDHLDFIDAGGMTLWIGGWNTKMTQILIVVIMTITMMMTIIVTMTTISMLIQIIYIKFRSIMISNGWQHLINSIEVLYIPGYLLHLSTACTIHGNLQHPNINQEDKDSESE